MRHDDNPFSPADADRHALWEMLVRRDIDGFVACDWAQFSGCFSPDGFLGLDAGGSADPADWTPRFPTQHSYRLAWEESARKAAGTAYCEDRRMALYRATDMRDIRIAGDAATARKTFDDAILLADGGHERLNWQSVFFCARRPGGDWRITGFVGFLPFPVGRAT